MKKFLIISFLLLSFGMHAQEKIQWMDFNEALKLNTQQPKKIFVDVYTHWCGWCKKMDASTFKDSSVIAYMNKHYYCVKLNAERKDTMLISGKKYIPRKHKQYHQLAVELLQGKLSFPSYAFLNEKGQLLSAVPGYKTVEQFEPIVKWFGENVYLRMKFEEYMKQFKPTF